MKKEFNANEARQLVAKAKDRPEIEQMVEEVLSRVRRTAERGHGTMNIDLEKRHIMNRELIETRLKALGFSVKFESCQREGDWWVISW